MKIIWKILIVLCNKLKNDYLFLPDKDSYIIKNIATIITWDKFVPSIHTNDVTSKVIFNL